MATPQLQQCFVSSSNPNGIGGDTGSAFKHTLAAPIGANNGVIFVASYPHGTTVSITDNNGNTWPAAAVTADAGVGNFALSAWVLPAAAAGLTTFELNVGATNIQPVSIAIYEYNNIATSSPVDVTASSINQSGTSLATGSMTTTVDGDLILFVAHPASNIGGNPTSWAAGSGFTLMEADIAWTSAQGYPKATQTQIQSTHGAITPAITINGDATDAFNCIAIALKTASAGTQYTGMRVLKHIEFCNNNLTTTTWKFQNPALGNLRAWGSTFSSGSITSCADSDSNTYTEAGFTTDSCVCFFAQNTTVNSTLTTTLTFPAGSIPNGFVFQFYDIVGAKTSGQPGAVASTDLIANATATFAHAPDFTPQSSNGSLILYFMQNQGTGAGSGPTLNITSPAIAVWAGMTYTNHTGGGQFDFGDGWGIGTNNTSTATQNVTWSLTAIPGNNLAGAAIEFLPAATAVIENYGAFQGRTFASQWTPDRNLLFHRRAGPEFSLGVETNPHYQPRTFPSQWNPTRNLWQTVPGDLGSAAAANPHWTAKPWPAQWFPTRWAMLNAPTDVPAAPIIDTPISTVPRTWLVQWNLQRSLMQGTAQDFSSSAPETNVHFVPRTWSYQWIVNRALMLTTAQDFSSTPVIPTGVHYVTTMSAKIITPIGVS